MIRATALGALVTGAGWLSLGLAFLWGNLAVLGFAVGLIAWSLAARGRVRAEFPAVEFSVGEATEGVDVTVEITVSGRGAGFDAIPAPIAGIRLLSEKITHSPGQVVVSQRIIPERSGIINIHGPRVFVTDKWGLHAREFHTPQVHRLAVKPASTWTGAGQRAGRRHTIQELVAGPRKLEIQPEVEAIRPWRPGDKLRDIDWPRSTRGELVARERVRVDPRPVNVVLDATSRMRWHRKTAKLTTGSRIAFGVLAAALAAGVEARMITVRDTNISMGKGTRGLSKAFDDLRRSDPPIPVDNIPSDVQATGGGTAFLRAASRLRPLGATSQPPLQEALAQALRRPGFVLLVVDCEEASVEAIAAMKRIRKDASGGVVMFASGAHHYSKHEGAEHLDRLETWKKSRESVVAVARRMRIPIAIVFPGDEEAIIEEVAAWLA